LSSPNREVSFNSAVISTPTWLNSEIDVVSDDGCFGDVIIPVMNSMVGYYGNPDGTSPKVGDVYYVRVAMGDLGGTCGLIYANVQIILPADTVPAIDNTNKVLCTTATTGNWNFVDVPAGQCPQSTVYGGIGWVFNRANGTPWDLSGGRLVVITIPVISKKAMSGSSTDSLLQGAVQAFNGKNNPWLNPRKAVTVAENPPSVTYEISSTTRITAITARTSATVRNHYVGGKVYFDIGTSTRYGDQGQVITINNDANAISVYQDWSGLEPNTTYHWRVRFVANGKSYTGADKKFKTLSR
jgi:hypothetical protein